VLADMKSKMREALYQSLKHQHQLWNEETVRKEVDRITLSLVDTNNVDLVLQSMYIKSDKEYIQRQLQQLNKEIDLDDSLVSTITIELSWKEFERILFEYQVESHLRK